MEPETEKKISGRNIAVISVFAFILIFIIYYSVMMMLSPGKKYAVLRNEFGIDTTEKSRKDNPVFSDSTYLNLLKEKAFLQSRLIMAETDSIYLTLNLSDSTVNLEISGVTVHTVKMSRIKISRMLENGDEFLISSMLSSPLTIENDISSIEKEPLMVSLAPRDTSEFQPDIIPDTTDIEPVSYIFEMTHGIRIYFYQEEEENAFHTFKFDLRDRLRNAFNTIRSAITLKIPEYNPYIKIFLPRADARIIYRAIPKNGQAAVYI